MLSCIGGNQFQTTERAEYTARLEGSIDDFINAALPPWRELKSMLRHFAPVKTCIAGDARGAQATTPRRIGESQFRLASRVIVRY